MPTARFYRRCSHESSKESGLGLEEQTSRVKTYYQLLKLDHPDIVEGEMYEDLAVSAWTTQFLSREGGAALNLASHRGDHIIFAELTRAFRSLSDAVDVLDSMIRIPAALDGKDWILYSELQKKGSGSDKSGNLCVIAPFKKTGDDLGPTDLTRSHGKNLP